MENDDEATPITTNGKHAPSAEAVRITNVGLIFSAMGEIYRDLGSSMDGLTDIEKRRIEIEIAKRLESSKASLDVLIDELLNPPTKS